MSPFGAGRMRLIAFGILLATFGVGILAGTAIDRVALADDARHEGRPGGRDGGRDRHHLIDELDLAPAQRASIDAILERRGERMRAVWSDMAPRLEAIADSTRQEIMTVLTPEQRADYEARLEERRQRWEREEAERRKGGAGLDGTVKPQPGDSAIRDSATPKNKPPPGI